MLEEQYPLYVGLVLRKHLPDYETYRAQVSVDGLKAELKLATEEKDETVRAFLAAQIAAIEAKEKAAEELNSKAPQPVSSSSSSGSSSAASLGSGRAFFPSTEVQQKSATQKAPTPRRVLQDLQKEITKSTEPFSDAVQITYNKLDSKTKIIKETRYVSPLGEKILDIIPKKPERGQDIAVLQRVWDEVLKDNQNDLEAQRFIAIIKAIPDLKALIEDAQSASIRFTNCD